MTLGVLDLTRFTEHLTQTPSLLRAVIEGRPDAWLDSKHAEDVFSPRETVAHLVLCERDSWVKRIRWVLDDDFVPPAEVEGGLLKRHTVYELLTEFEAIRLREIKELEGLGLTESDLEKARADEELGSQSVSHILSTWVAHDLYHLGQIFKSYSAPYRDQIGPYQQFLNLPHFN